MQKACCLATLALPHDWALRHRVQGAEIHTAVTKDGYADRDSKLYRSVKSEGNPFASLRYHGTTCMIVPGPDVARSSTLLHHVALTERALLSH
jgi:hypothetical protein